MTDNTLLVSLTTWPPRLYSSLLTILKLKRAIYNLDAKIILVLSKDEFPYCMKSLPPIFTHICSNINMEIIFDEGNIKAHKKLIPTIEKYPDNDILVFDDDKLYDETCVKEFIESHKKYPNDVIVGRSHFRLIPQNGKIISKLHFDSFNQWEIPNALLYNSKQASGLSGTLYPKHTFTNSMFFDRKLLIENCEESDEDWQFLFNIMDDKTLRAKCVINEYPNNNGNSKCALWKCFGQNHYDKYYDNFLKLFPDFYDKLYNLNKEYEKNVIKNIII